MRLTLIWHGWVYYLIKPIILKSKNHLMKPYSFESHQFLLLPVNFPWQCRSLLGMIRGKNRCLPSASLPSYLPFFPHSFCLSFFSKSNLHEWPANCMSHLSPPKVPCALQPSFISSQPQWFSNESILAWEYLTSRLFVKKDMPRTI